MKRKGWGSAINLVANAYGLKDLDSILTPQTHVLDQPKNLKFSK
jgi:hypothetical protein